MKERVATADKVTVREVGLRDGLQMVATVLSTDQKLAWCRAAAAAGVRDIEVTSFVPRKSLPQFFDAADVACGALAIPGLSPCALVVNVKGAVRAFDAGLKRVTCVISASEAHSRANARRSTNEAIAEYARIRRERDSRIDGTSIALSCGIATAFGCTLQGEVSPRRVCEISESLCAIGIEEIMLADTVGYANPAQVAGLFRDVARSVGDTLLAGHFHDTRGLGLANVCAAMDVGVRRFDSSLAGLGGCPFAPGASGNIVTEDMVFMLEAMGFETGIDIGALLELRRMVESWLPGERFCGALARAGLPMTFHARKLPGDIDVDSERPGSAPADAAVTPAA